MIEPVVAGLLKSGGHAVSDKSGPPHFAEGGCKQHPAGVCTQLFVRGAAHDKITFFEGVGEGQRPPQFMFVHDSCGL